MKQSQRISVDAARPKWSTPGKRKVNAAAVNRPEAIAEIHKYIGGKAVRLGDIHVVVRRHWNDWRKATIACRIFGASAGIGLAAAYSVDHRRRSCTPTLSAT